MKLSGPGGIWLLIGLLTVTVGVKAAAIHNAFDRKQDYPPTERRLISSWLGRQHFRITPAAGDDDPFIQASRGQCQLTILSVDAHGYHRETLRKMASEGAQALFVYKGEVYPEQPVWRTWLDHHLWARARDVGIRTPRFIVLGVVARACRVDGLPWKDVDRIS